MISSNKCISCRIKLCKEKNQLDLCAEGRVELNADLFVLNKFLCKKGLSNQINSLNDLFVLSVISTPASKSDSPAHEINSSCYLNEKDTLLKKRIMSPRNLQQRTTGFDYNKTSTGDVIKILHNDFYEILLTMANSTKHSSTSRFNGLSVHIKNMENFLEAPIKSDLEVFQICTWLRAIFFLLKYSGEFLITSDTFDTNKFFGYCLNQIKVIYLETTQTQSNTTEHLVSPKLIECVEMLPLLHLFNMDVTGSQTTKTPKNKSKGLVISLSLLISVGSVAIAIVLFNKISSLESLAEKNQYNLAKEFAPRIDNQEIDLHDLQVAVSNLQNDTSNIQKNTSKSISELKANLSTTKTDLSAAKKDIVGMEGNLKDIKSDISLLRKDTKNLQGQYGELQSQIKTLSSGAKEGRRQKQLKKK